MKDIRFAKFVVFINGAVPLLLLGWDAWNHHLGAGPGLYAIHTTGMLALVFLTLSLVVTPVRKLTGLNWLIFSRRTLGLYAFFYACLHLFLFYSVQWDFNFSSTVSEIWKRNYLLIGMSAIILMAPLAATSFNVMIKRMGAKRWKALHRLVYLAASAGVIHFYMQSKSDKRLAWVFIAALSILLAFRLISFLATPKPAGAVWKGFDIEPSRPRFWSGTLRLVSIIQETPDVRTFRMAPADGSRLPFQHQPGQYLTLSLTVDGKKVNRTYTIASSPTRPEYCEITVKREEGGIASNHLHTALKEGDTLKVSAPAGRFTFDATGAGGIVLIAGGVGITPLMSILRHLADEKWPGQIYFLYSAKTQQDIIFRQELADLQARLPNLHAVITLTRPDGTPWTGPTGRITADLLKRTIPNLTQHPYFLCGPTPMMDPMIELLASLGIPPAQIKTEAFIPAKRVAAATPMSSSTANLPVEESADQLMADGDATATFALSKRTVPLPPDKCLLEVAEDAGLSPDFECRSGICGRCKTRLISGKVTMDVQDALDPEDKSRNLILLCQARALESVAVEA